MAQRVQMTATQVLAWNVFLLRTNRYPRWSRKRLAELAGVSLRKIDDIENLRDPEAEEPQLGVSLRIVERIAAALGVEVIDLFDPHRAEEAATRVSLQGRPPALRVVSGGWDLPRGFAYAR